MPVKNRVKKYLADGYYHIYNRGVEKRLIFQDKQDYSVLFSYLKEYLEPKKIEELRNALVSAKYQEKDKLLKKISMNNFSEEISLLCFCLMPNHFHLLVQQSKERSIEKFMKSVFTRYVMYFNNKYKRVGGLFESVYKAVMVKTDEQLFHLTRYIHQNPAFLNKYNQETFINYPYSSIGVYLGKQVIDWVKPEIILGNFSKTNSDFSYESFVNKSLENDKHFLKSISLDD